MTKAAEAVLVDALQPDVKARADRAAELQASLDGPSDPDADRWLQKCTEADQGQGPSVRWRRRYEVQSRWHPHNDSL